MFVISLTKALYAQCVCAASSGDYLQYSAELRALEMDSYLCLDLFLATIVSNRSTESALDFYGLVFITSKRLEQTGCT